MMAGKGEFCAYCQRELQDTTSPYKLAATRDHLIPKHLLDEYLWNNKIWACRQCNCIKGGMLPEDWFKFMKDNPKWWTYSELQFGTNHKKVERMKRREYFKAKAKALTEGNRPDA